MDKPFPIFPRWEAVFSVCRTFVWKTGESLVQAKVFLCIVVFFFRQQTLLNIASLTQVYILVMQCFRVVYREVSHEWLDFSWYTHEPLDECVYKAKSSHERDIHDIPRESTAELIYPMPLIELTFLFNVWFQEFKIKEFFFHVLVVDSNFFLNENFDLSQALLSAGKICGPRGTPRFFSGILPVT